MTAVGRMGVEVVGVLDAERAERDLRQERRRPGCAELELDGQRVERRDLLELARVRRGAAGASPRLGVGHARRRLPPASADGAAEAGASLAGEADDVVPPQAAKTSARRSRAASRSGKLAERVMRWYSSSNEPRSAAPCPTLPAAATHMAIAGLSPALVRPNLITGTRGLLGRRTSGRRVQQSPELVDEWLEPPSRPWCSGCSASHRAAKDRTTSLASRTAHRGSGRGP